MYHSEQDLLMDLSTPDAGVIETLSKLKGDLLLLGAAGKIGHALSLMAKRAIDEAGVKPRVLAVSRFSSPGSREALEADGIECLPCDLTDSEAVRQLPDASDIIYLAGQKFGTGGNPGTTWLLNTVVPAVVCQRWPQARIAAYSSGNVYPFYPADSNGPDESQPTGPIGEYAQSVLGRERIFEYFSREAGTPVTLIRLNYANEPRYGVLVDLATPIMNGEPVDLSQGYVNVVWQGDCNLVTLKCLDMADSPPATLNLAGPKLPVKELAEKLAAALGATASFKGEPAQNALLNDGSYCWNRFGGMQVGVDEMITRIADWLKQGGQTMGKRTHFEVRDGKF